MIRTTRLVRRALGAFEDRLRRARPGSVLILVVALLVLMALIGTAYISRARTDRHAAQQNAFTTEIELLVQGVINMTEDAIETPVYAGNFRARTYNSPAVDLFSASRVPVLVSGTTPGWLYISASPAGGSFESPYIPAGNGAYNSQYATRQNLQPTFIEIDLPSGNHRYPALTDGANTYLAASASGDGIADSGLFRLPIGQLNGVTYYGAVRVVDNNSAINPSIAWEPNPAGQPNPWGMLYNFFPTNINMAGLLRAGDTMPALNSYRTNNAAGFNPPIDDAGNSRADFQFANGYDALHHQLGRRLGNPGRNPSNLPYQAVPLVESMWMGYHFCLKNAFSSPSLLETDLPNSVYNTARSDPYNADQSAQWFSDYFDLRNETPGNAATYHPLRPLLAAFNPVTNFTVNKVHGTNAGPGAWSSAGNYIFGDWVTFSVAGVSQSYVCIQNTGLAANGNAAAVPAIQPVNDPSGLSSIYWAWVPYINNQTHTSINVADYAQLWTAFWSVMTDTQTTVPAGTDTGIYRNPVRSPTPPVVMAGGGGNTPGVVNVKPGDDIQNAIDTSNDGDTILFAGGTYSVSTRLNLKSNRNYVGTYTPQAGITLSPKVVMQIRSALAALNAANLRSGTDDVTSRLINLGDATAAAPTSQPAGPLPVLQWAGGDDHLASTPDGTTQNIKILGLDFSGSGIKIGDNAQTVIISQCVIEQNQVGGNARNLIYNPGGMAQCQIVQNVFKESPGSWGVECHSPDNCQFTDNTFTNVHEGIHLDFTRVVANGGGGRNCTVSRNIGSQIWRHFIECQAGAQNLTVSDNYCSNFHNQFPDGSQHDGHIALSIATGKQQDGSNNSHGVKITGNTILGTGFADNPPDYHYCAIEAMGDGFTISGNYVYNWGFGELIDYATNWTTIGNTFVGVTQNNPAYEGPSSPPSTSADTSYALNDPSAPPAPPPPQQGGGPANPPTIPTGTPTVKVQYQVMIYSASRQPFITEVYANNDAGADPSGQGYMAVELYNPYDRPINMTGWKLAYINRPALATSTPSLIPTDLGATTLPTSIAAKSYIVLATSAMAPPNITRQPASNGGTMVLVPQLNTAFDNELVLLRPRSASGPGASTDPANPYDETKGDLSQWAPVDSYDFSGLVAPAVGSQSQEWHYIRPSDASRGKAWHFVYPGVYSATAAGAALSQPRQQGTAVYPNQVKTNMTDLSSFGVADAASEPNAAKSNDKFAIQIHNQTGDALKVPPGNNAYPFNGFARNGDILQTPYIGGYRVQLANGGAIVEINSLTMDCAFADDNDPNDDAEEEVGRFCPIDMQGNDDYSPESPTTAPLNKHHYAWAMSLFDYLTTQSPAEDFLPDVNSSQWGGTAPVPVANAKPSVVNALVTNKPMGATEDTSPIHGQININTASAKVLSALPMMSDPAQNMTLAQAIVAYRDVDDGTTPGTPHPHGSFKTIFELEKVPGFKTFNGSYNPLGQTPNDFEPRYLALSNISSLITTKADSYTAYILVQGWKRAGTATPELVVQRRAAFIADRTMLTPNVKAMSVTNMPTD